MPTIITKSGNVQSSSIPQDTKYLVVQDKQVEDVVRTVDAIITNGGFQPTGGIVALSGTVYFQAMVRSSGPIR